MDGLMHGFPSALGRWMRNMNAGVGRYLWVSAPVVNNTNV